MKKNYFLINALVVLLGIQSFKTEAQALSGLYSINAGAGPSTTNFISFTAFVAALNTNGVSGPVTVDVVTNSGPYVEQVQFMQPAGVSGSNKVTINGNGNLITFNSNNSAQAWTIAFNGTDWVTINELNVQGTGNSFAFPLILFGGANSNYFSACTFSCNPNQGTGTSQIPVVVSGAGNTYANTSNSGNNNTWIDCATFGGYFGFTLYGPTTPGSYNYGNKIINTSFRDYYVYGFYGQYHEFVTLSGCLAERPTRTNHTTAYGILLGNTSGSIIEECTVQKLYEQSQTNTNQAIGIYLAGNTNAAYSGDKNVVRNNIVQDIRSHGQINGYYMLYVNGDVYHNTLSIEHPTATSGGVWGIYYVTTGNKYINSANNLIYVNRGGATNKFGLYYGTTALVTSDNNNIWVGPSGTNYFAGFSGGNMATLANLQTATNQEATTYSIDPVFVNPTNDVRPTSIALDNLALPKAVVFDHGSAIRNITTPDIGAIEFLSPNCSGVPSANSIAGPSWSLCPGEDASMVLGTLVPDLGLTYQWQSSAISNVGPFINIPGATNLMYTAPGVTAQTWYSVVMTCTNPGGGSISSVIQINVAGPTLDNVPYYEGFETIGMADRLPNCSWLATDQGATNRTSPVSQSGNRVARNGSSFGYFNNATTGTSAFYTNPINMSTGITYSAAVHYATEYFGYNNWTNLSIWIGPNQSTLGLVQAASVGPAITGAYKLLDGTFTVPSAGIYYVAIRATSSAGSAQFLSIDDISVTIPCHVGSGNEPNLSSSVSTNTICEGQTVSLNATGADTYTWSTGSNVPSTSDNPLASQSGYTIYTVSGQNAITGCVATSTQMVYVNPAPNVFVVASPPIVCAGQPVNLSAYGALTYAWNTNQIGSNITVNPTTNSSYTVVGTNAFGCSTSYGYNVTVYPLPTINAVSSQPTEACKDDELILTASGGSSYIWISNVSNLTYQGNPIMISSPATAIFTVTGTNANGCQGKFTLLQSISDCTGLDIISGKKELSIYPNPTVGEFSLEFDNSDNKTVEVTDVTGRLVLSTTNDDSTMHINIKNLSNGIYYVKVKYSDSVEVVKILKQQ